MKSKVLCKLLTVVAVILISQASSGQHRITPEERAQRLTERMKTELSLTTKQVQKVYELNLRYDKKIEKARRDNFDNRVKMRENMKSFSIEKDKEMKRILSKKQYKKYQDMKNNIRLMIRNNREKSRINKRMMKHP